MLQHLTAPLSPTGTTTTARSVTCIAPAATCGASSATSPRASRRNSSQVCCCCCLLVICLLCQDVDGETFTNDTLLHPQAHANHVCKLDDTMSVCILIGGPVETAGGNPLQGNVPISVPSARANGTHVVRQATQWTVLLLPGSSTACSPNATWRRRLSLTSEEAPHDPSDHLLVMLLLLLLITLVTKHHGFLCRPQIVSHTVSPAKLVPSSNLPHNKKRKGVVLSAE